VMLPQADPEQPLPLRLHSTAESVLPTTVVLNCSWPFTTTTEFAGEMLTVTGAIIVTVAEADLVGSATDVAFTVTCGVLGILFGAA
jgi:hypothetical protein